MHRREEDEGIMSSPQLYLTLKLKIKLHYYIQSSAAPYFVKRGK